MIYNIIKYTFFQKNLVVNILKWYVIFHYYLKHYDISLNIK